MMNITKSSNPVFKEKVFNRDYMAQSDVMTVSGTMNKTSILLLLVVASAVFTWNKFFDAIAFNPESGMATVAPWLIVGGIGGFIAVLVTVFRPQSSGISAPIYAIFEGLFLGGISAIFEMQYGGIVVRAVALTLAVFVIMLFLYRSGAIKVTQKFRMGIFAATGGIALVYLFSFIGGFFGMDTSFLHGSSNLSIGISLFVVAIAALNLILDFSFIEKASAQGAPKYMEWYGAFGLMVTLIWLYLEILRLLSKLASRD
ncbi:Bax inhibitor-1/YccA family protein [Prolixibacteraceae bacterium Z1-6]|uniref:Bax inhibitor-1/YccA family protein n=1 Tax=Draconibacterium aestuarii TaxID=2998507 RepID=A0A9X3FCR2_9BACT|nr:Bax inhibitor-1/YccA family protein [Prolixibacteraceae bacterium Z1-6]